MYAKKSLGQHFLRSERALSEIIEAGRLDKEDTVLEIGPGQGVLTEKLLPKVKWVTAIEKDDLLYEFLQERFASEIKDKKLRLIHSDVLDFDLEILDQEIYKVVANIPYNITGAILEKFLSTSNQPSQMVLLVQDEVAKRIVARDGKESILSISVKVYGTPRYVHKVLAGSFVPAPKVDSAVISIENISKKFFAEFSEDKFFKILKAGFSAKRKKLSRNLESIFDKKLIAETFTKLNLNQNLRAEDLNPETWHSIANNLLNQKG